MAKTPNSGAQKSAKRKRPGIHSKNSIDLTKGKPGWKKAYRGQGR